MFVPLRKKLSGKVLKEHIFDDRSKYPGLRYGPIGQRVEKTQKRDINKKLQLTGWFGMPPSAKRSGKVAETRYKQ